MMLDSFYLFYDSIFNKEFFEKEYIGEKAYNFSRISYIVNLDFAKKGNGLGGNYIVEMYEIGREYGVFFFSFLFIVGIHFLENSFKRNDSVYKNIFAIMVLKTVFIAPRSFYFGFNIRDYIYLCSSYFIMSTCINILRLSKK